MARRLEFALREDSLRVKSPDRSLGLLLSLAYGLAATFAVGLGVALGRPNLLWHPEPWLTSSPWGSVAKSLALGLALSFGVIAATRFVGSRFAWARELSSKLTPFARTLSEKQVVWVAILSSVGEELLFRGLFAPYAGILASSLVFGMLHQVQGRARIPWLVSATIMGAAFAGIYQLTGSLVGPIVAHATINAANLRYLKNRAT